MKLTVPFVRLPLAFDAARLAAEVASLPASAWMSHPSGLAGNTAVALVSREGGDNHDFAGPMRPTPRLQAMPCTREVMAGFGEVLSRSRLMRLAPGAEVSAHVDFNYHWYTRVRMHVPVITNPAVTFHCGDARVHMAAGECWIFDNWRRHRVVNAGNADRVHLVIDLAGSSRFWRLVRETIAAGEAGASEQHAPGWHRAGAGELLTEQWTQSAVMAPGELQALVDELLLDLEANPANDRALLARYRVLLQDFCHDWRVTWLRHGPAPEAVPDYRRLLEAVTAGLHPQRRALVTASNDVGANPVIQQRIVRAALAPEHVNDPGV